MKRLFADQQPNRPVKDQPPKTAQAPTQMPSRTSTFVVGCGIVVSGEIQSCECLIVEGIVEANVVCRELRVTTSGSFKGKACVFVAEIAGSFCGDLEVGDRLLVRASGKVTANLHYQQVEVERGGEICGQVKRLGTSEVQRAVSSESRSAQA